MPAPWQGTKTTEEQFASKMTDEHRMLIYRLHAEGMGPSLISRTVKDSEGIAIPVNTIIKAYSAKKALPYIGKFRDDYMAKVKEVPIANKRIRLDDYEKIRSKLMGFIEKSPAVTKGQRAEMLMMMRRLIEAECAAREEMENKPLMIQQVSVSELRDFSDEALQKRQEELIAKARGTFKGRDFGIGASGEGAVVSDKPEPA